MEELNSLEYVFLAVAWAAVGGIAIVALVWFARAFRPEDEGQSDPKHWSFPPAETPITLLSPERRYELWRKELAAWTDEDGTQVGLDALLERWRGVPHEKPVVEPRPVRMIGGWRGLQTEDGAQPVVKLRMDPTPSAAEGKPPFRTGQWVRVVKGHHTGKLAMIFSVWERSCDATMEPGVGCYGPAFRFDEIEPAVPRKGEWWFKAECANKQHRENTGPQIAKGWAVGEDGKEMAACGCLTPFNFGRGEEAKA